MLIILYTTKCNLLLYCPVFESQSRPSQIPQSPERFQLRSRAATLNLCSLSDLQFTSTSSSEL